MSKKELSPSEYEEMISTGRNSPTNTKLIKYGVMAVVALILCGISFGAGMSYQKGKKPTSTATAGFSDNGQFPSQAGGPGGQGGFGNGQRPNIGEVSAISSDNITIKAVRSNSNQSFRITSSTTVQNNDSTASASDIKTGDTVLITTDDSDSSTASQIIINPSFGPPSGGTQGSSSLQ